MALVMRVLYSALLYLSLPLVLARLLWRSRRLPAYRLRWRERLGGYGKAKSWVTHGQSSIWLHAVSVGEVEAALPLIRALQASDRDCSLVVTTTTPTGSQRVQAELGEDIAHVYVPYDLPDAVGRFLSHFRPTLGIILETELWPNLLQGCRVRGIPLVLVNGRLSEKSCSRYRLFPSLIRNTLDCLDCLAVQTETDANRFLFLGAHPERVTITGNLKFDLNWPEGLLEDARTFRAKHWPNRRIWLCASTHEGEEDQLIPVYRRLRQSFPDLLWILAPRHPDRFEVILRMLRSAGLVVTRRSQNAMGHRDVVLLLDTLGELKFFYCLADVAFVGGSLVAVGGHNILEPARAGVPVLFGPHMTNYSDIARQIQAAGGGRQVEDCQMLYEKAAELLADARLREIMGRRGRQFVDQNQGALSRTLALLAPFVTGGCQFRE